MYQYSNVRVLGVNLIHDRICADIALTPNDAARKHQGDESQSALAVRLTDSDCRFGSVIETVHGIPEYDNTMKIIRERARNSFPSVLLTLLSIVQAVALETLWEQSRHRLDLFDASWMTLASWLQLSATLLAILFVWLLYVGLVMRFRFSPELSDLILPFFVGLLEFLMIEMTYPGRLGEWFVVLALISAIVTYIRHDLFRRARRDPENCEFFDVVPKATWRDHLLRIIPTVLIALTGIWIWTSGDQIWLACIATLLVLIGITIQIRTAAKYWRISMGDDS